MTDLPVARPVEPCEVSYDVYECGCGRRLRAKGCNKVDCPTCKPWLTLRRAGAVYDRLDRRPDDRTVCYTVLTFPESIREQLAFPGELQRLRKEAWTLLKSLGAEWGYSAVHPVGSQRVCPDCGYSVRFTSRRYCPHCGAQYETKDGELFHPHLNFLWVPRAGVRGFIDVRKLQDLWSSILKVDVSVVYHQYAGDTRRIRHWSRYVARTFPGWSWYTGPVRWYGKPPKAEKLEPCKCEKCGQVARYVGHVSRWEVQRWEESGRAIGLDPPWMKPFLDR